jgi:FkbM family methyltransferase
MPQILKDIAIRLAQRMGYTVIPNWRFERFHTASFMRRLFDFLDIDCVIDVGANTGQYRQFLRQEIEYQGYIVSFEPIPHHVTLLKEQARHDPKWIVNGCALGAHAGSSEFNIMANTEFSSFLKPTHDNVEIFRGQNDIQEKVLVKVRTLDDVILECRKELGSKNIYLKLDTQGFDLEVLKGATNTLQSLRALQTEASVRKIYDGMPRYDETIRFLEERGFVMSGIYPNNAGHFPLLVEFDCYMINHACVP